MKKAFTIVEVILVLSISSLFAVGMMVGWNINIERQRYNDTVNTLKSDIQGIFNEVENPTNVSEDNFACRQSGDLVFIDRSLAAASGRRGATECALLGKLVNFDIDRSQIQTVDIVGNIVDLATACGSKPCENHIEALRASNISFDGSGFSDKDMDIQWNNKISLPDNVGSFIVVRSPLDNTLLAFFRNGRMVDVAGAGPRMNDLRDEFLNEANLMSDGSKVGVCVESENTTFGERKRLVLIGGMAASVEIAPLDSGRGC